MKCSLLSHKMHHAKKINRLVDEFLRISGVSRSDGKRDNVNHSRGTARVGRLLGVNGVNLIGISAPATNHITKLVHVCISMNIHDKCMPHDVSVDRESACFRVYNIFRTASRSSQGRLWQACGLVRRRQCARSLSQANGRTYCTCRCKLAIPIMKFE